MFSTPRVLLSLLALGATLAALRADNWPAWRGPHGDGRCDEKNLPLTWSATENVRWKVALPGPGNSTPIIWKDRIFLTQATKNGEKRSLLCLERSNGNPIWEETVAYTEKERTHGTNPYCSASPATDGERVVVSHGSAGLFCYDFAGKQLWKRDLGKCDHIWGNAASPVLHGDLCILNFGPGERTFLLAVNKRTGEDVWKVDEPGGKAGDKGPKEWVGSWSTPVVVKVGDRDELIMSWPGAVKAYDPKKGDLLWTCRGLEKDKADDKLVYTSPVVTADAVVALGGFGGAGLAVKPGGSGDVTDSHRLWRHPQGPQRIGSGVIVGEHFYIVNEPGLAQCLDLKTGKTVFNERVGGNWGSLVHTPQTPGGPRLYVTDLQGTTHVLAAKPKFEVLARNALGERTLASLAFADGDLFVRTYKHLWCIGK